MSILEKLTEGIVNRDLRKEGAALLSKWERTGLLEGIDKDRSRQAMARLLENQAKELLRESSQMSAGDVEGFASVAFPIVRRVFGGLIANDLVSVQPMSLPSGLIFFLDFRYSPNLGDTTAEDRFGNAKDTSIYGGGVVGSAITGGVSLVGTVGEDLGGPYTLGGIYGSPTGSHAALQANQSLSASLCSTGSIHLDEGIVEGQKKLLDYDADVLDLASGVASGSATLAAVVVSIPVTGSSFDNADFDNLTAFSCSNAHQTANGVFTNANTVNPTIKLIRRLTRPDPAAPNSHILMTFVGTKGALGHFSSGSSVASAGDGATDTKFSASFALVFPLVDNFNAGSSIGSVVGATEWALEAEAQIPEIDIKVDSIAVTAQTKKLKAKWTPELGQDLNAYHNLDAEVELTQILSEQIALELDREIIQDLIRGGTAGTLYWSRSPGLFVNRETGVEIGASSAAPDFTGTVSEWYETLIETINDVSARIHRKTLRGGANFVVCSPEVANILEFTSGFRAAVTADADRGTIGAVKAGNLSKKFDVYVDPYFPRNIILVGRMGGSFLESGYVYAPYVPLQVTPTIFGVEDFVPRKGVMTRYAKQMVRSDMYGLVICRGLSGEAGATS